MASPRYRSIRPVFALSNLRLGFLIIITHLILPGGARLLRHDNYIATLQNDVLFEVAPPGNVSVSKLDQRLTSGGSPEYLDVVQFRKRGRTTGKRECLHDVHGRIHDELPRILDLAEYVDAIAHDLFDRYGNDWIRDVLREPFRDAHLDLIDRAPCSIEYADEREGNPAIRLHGDFTLKVLLSPDRYFKQVAWLNRVKGGPVLSRAGLLSKSCNGNREQQGSAGQQLTKTR